MYKILIVEDDAVIAESLKNSLGQWNYEVKCISDCKEVMKEFIQFQPHIVILDISLP